MKYSQPQRFLCLLGIALLLLLQSGCGQTGPLYLPVPVPDENNSP